MAKWATGWRPALGTSDGPRAKGIPGLNLAPQRSAADQWSRTTIRRMGRQLARQVPKAPGKKLHDLKPTIRSKDRIIYSGMTPSERSVLFQTRSNELGPNGWLARAANKGADTDRYPRCRCALETRHHLLITCPAYRKLMIKIWFDSQSCPQNLKGALNDPKHTLCTARFLLQTKRLAYLAPLRPYREDDDDNNDSGDDDVVDSSDSDTGGSGLT